MSMYSITASKGVNITFTLSSFSGNCGYRIMYGDRANGYAQLTSEEKKYLNKMVFHLLSAEVFKSFRKVVMSEVVRSKSWLYNFIEDNKLQVGSPVSINLGSSPHPSKTILAEFNPFDAPKPPKPRRPRGYKVITPDFISNIKIQNARMY